MLEKICTQGARNCFGMTAVERNSIGNTNMIEMTSVDSEFLVVSATNVEMPDQAMPKNMAKIRIRAMPGSPVTTLTPNSVP